ncbi:CPBP family intramembrane metalloprotease [Balneolaceae bacterium YR4-1]|uniref:CPBP family intramembrane metalloprotease n=1 Tax=Halalkalibaculum roseum TaxID=2709311 RepID=A0A6M1T114_9BACT|nr:type II CAAX endopeptidase family protein [Halalkalibaculum roseum]NGP77796.1 CPBP family intramembrane metalloprotease [Halalkalibaculum roseum]
MNIFVNHEEQRLRAGWRIFLQFILFVLLVFGFMLVRNVLSIAPLKIYDALLMCSAGILSVWIATRLWDKRAFSDYGLASNRLWFRELGFGLLLGLAAMSLIFVIQWSAGWIEITGYGWERSSTIPYLVWILSYFMAMLIVGFYEELIFRGYQIINLVEGFRSERVSLFKAALLAVLISSTIFGLLHAGNPNATIISTVNIVFAGVMLAVPFLVTGRLGISVGIHISWNFVQGGLLGFAVSGTPFRGSLVQIRQGGEKYLTGGSFGPEAGLIGIFGMLFILAIFFVYTRRNSEGLKVHSSFKNGASKSVNQDE